MVPWITTTLMRQTKNNANHNILEMKQLFFRPTFDKIGFHKSITYTFSLTYNSFAQNLSSDFMIILEVDFQHYWTNWCPVTAWKVSSGDFQLIFRNLRSSLSLSVTGYKPSAKSTAQHHHQLCQLPCLGNPDILLLGAAWDCADIHALLLHLIFSSRCWSCYVCLGQASGLSKAITSPPTQPMPPPIPPTTPSSGRGAFLATMAPLLSQGLALVTVLDLATTSNGGRITDHLISSALSSLIPNIDVFQKSWPRSEFPAIGDFATRGRKGGRDSPGGDSAEVILTPKPADNIFTFRFDTRPPPASPQSQVLVRQEENGDPATNSETFQNFCPFRLS